MSANRQEFKIRNRAEAIEHLQVVLMWIWYTPSAADKLPKFVLESAYMLEKHTDKHGWDWLLDSEVNNG